MTLKMVQGHQYCYECANLMAVTIMQSFTRLTQWPLSVPEENNEVVWNALVIEGLLKLLNGALLLHLSNHVHELETVTKTCHICTGKWAASKD